MLADFAPFAAQQSPAPALFIVFAPAVDAVTAETPEAEPLHPSWEAAVAFVVWAEQPDVDAVEAFAADVVFFMALQLPDPAALPCTLAVVALAALVWFLSLSQAMA
jgi:hypothetical protein